MRLFSATVERLEQARDGRVVGVLGLGEAAAVDAIVDVRINQLIVRVSRSPVGRRIELSPMLYDLVEGRVQQLEDVHRLVRHELPGLLVEEGRRRLGLPPAGRSPRMEAGPVGSGIKRRRS